MIFQALGSTNTFRESLGHLFLSGTAQHSERLAARLEKTYGGKAFLYAKGRYALAAAFQAAGAKSIAINGFTCSVVVDAVLSAGATPVFIDIDETYHFSAETLEKVLKNDPAIRVVVVQNTFGRMCDITSIEKIVRRYGCILIEDLAHSIGLAYDDGRKAGTVGDLVMLSFGRDKVVDVVNGGALIVRSEELVDRITTPTRNVGRLDRLRDRLYPLLSHAIRSTYRIGIGKVLLAFAYKTRLAVRSADGAIDTNLRLAHWKSRLVLGKLDRLDATLGRRQEIAALYRKLLPEKLGTTGIIRVALQVPDQKAALKALRSQGFMLDDTWYDTPIGPARKYKEYRYPETANTYATEISKHVINLPTHKYVSEKTVRSISAVVKEQL